MGNSRGRIPVSRTAEPSNTVDIATLEPESAEENVALPIPGSSLALAPPLPFAAGELGPTGLEETRGTESVLLVHTQSGKLALPPAVPRAALAAMSDDELAVQLGALQAERDRRHRVMPAAGLSGDADDGPPKTCSWFACAPTCDHPE